MIVRTAWLVGLFAAIAGYFMGVHNERLRQCRQGWGLIADAHLVWDHCAEQHGYYWWPVKQQK